MKLFVVQRLLMLAAAGALPALSAAAAPTEPVPGQRITVELSDRSRNGTVAVSLPGDNNVPLVVVGDDWSAARSLQFSISWPAAASTNAQVLVYMKDWDHFWYQALLPGYLAAGEKNDFSVDLTPAAADIWQPVGHFGVWHHRALQKPTAFGVRIFGGRPFSGDCRLSDVWAARRKDTGAPWIRGVHALDEQVPCHGKFEVTFAIPDRYTDPFDPDTVAVAAVFRAPTGRAVTVDGFYGCDYFRQSEATGDTLVAQGSPYWRVRFTPTEPGRYTYTLRVTDRLGSTEWGPGGFTATPSADPGFIRVARSDPRYLEFANGRPFFPVGHNIRSPNDARVEKNFPWTHRWHEGAASYERRFAKMEAEGSNFAEVWSASWSLGLEWRGDWLGYRGVGQYNLMNAWDFDRVLDAAAAHGIYLNFVVHNHGKFSTFSDEEWHDNPFNTAIGGFLSSPEGYFSDPRALASFRKLMRYMIARWGYSTHLFSWQLWSELNLAGSDRQMSRRPVVQDWHRMMARDIKAMDPNDHLIASHVSGDYASQNPALIRLPEMDYCPVDAYHNSASALHIVDLMQRTAEFNNPYGKPVLITEFGGTAMGAGLKHIVDSLHAALWASTCVPIAGTPLLWWWHLVEEENLYPMYGAVSRFMADVDRRDQTMVTWSEKVRLTRDANADGTLAALCMANRRRAHGWVYHQERFETIDPAGPPATTGAVLRVSGMAEGVYDVEFWSTRDGVPVAQGRVKSNGATLNVPIAPFARDIAFKLRRTR